MASMKEMADTLIKRINDLATPVKIMHVCGSHERMSCVCCSFKRN